MTRAEIIAEIIRRRECLIKNPKTEVALEPEMLRDLDDMELSVDETDEVFNEKWEQHDFRWQAYVAELRRSIVRRTAHIAMAYEDIQRKNPHQFDGQPDVQQLLEWWRKTGRAEYLGQITLEERRALEEMERQWRSKNT